MEQNVEGAVSEAIYIASEERGQRPPKKKKIRMESVYGYIFTLLPLFGYVFFSGFTLVFSFVVMFCSMDNFDMSSLAWNNFENFKLVFTDSRFWHSLKITLWVASAQLVSLSIALIISILLNKKVRGSKIFQILFFVPYICSSVAVSVMWKWMFNTEYGIINSLFGLSVDWMQDPSVFTWTIFIAIIWQAPGYGIVMYKSALEAVSPSLYEAADLDGANAWHKVFYITLPTIAPTTFYLLMTGVIAGFLSFDIPKMMAGVTWTGTAGVGDMGLTTTLYIYIRGIMWRDMAQASVMSWFMFVIVFSLSFMMFKIRNRRLKND